MRILESIYLLTNHVQADIYWQSTDPDDCLSESFRQVSTKVYCIGWGSVDTITVCCCRNCFCHREIRSQSVWLDDALMCDHTTRHRSKLVAWFPFLLQLSKYLAQWSIRLVRAFSIDHRRCLELELTQSAVQPEFPYYLRVFRLFTFSTIW